MQLHQKYAKEGLVALSVSLDNASEPDTEKKVLEFLTKMNATFTHFILDESQDFWMEKFQTFQLPCIYVFNQEGKWTKFGYNKDGKWTFPGGNPDEPYKDVEKFVKTLLEKK